MTDFVSIFPPGVLDFFFPLSRRYYSQIAKWVLDKAARVEEVEKRGRIAATKGFKGGVGRSGKAAGSSDIHVVANLVL